MTIRPARPEDASAIAEVHVAAWRSAYANLLPAAYLASMSTVRHAAQAHQAILAGHGVLVAEHGNDVVGFCTMGRSRTPGLADAEIETLYVLDDYRDQGHGRALLQAAAIRLAAQGCGSLFLWVLADNPSRFFYERMGGKPVRRGTALVARHSFDQLAYAWDPIVRLTAPASA